MNDHEAEVVASDDDPSVIGGSEVRSDRGPQARRHVARYVLTNRMNLNGILSSRIVGPRESYGKYYPDLLQLTDGRVPVLPAPPSPELVAFVSSKVRTGPALLELSPAPVADPGAFGQVELLEAIPFHEVRAMHLPDGRSLREHLARQYSNVHPHKDLLHVSPELFEGFVGLDDVATATSAVPNSRVVIDWKRVDRVRGAMNAAVLAASTPDALELASALLPAPDSGDDADGGIGTWLRRFPQQTQPSEYRFLTADDALLLSVLEVLATTDVREAWSPATVLRQVRRQLDAHPVPSVDAELIALNLATVEAVADGSREFTPFRRTGRGLVSAKALLLILIREELSEIIAWPVHETGADAATVQLAALMAGMLRGLSRESIGLRTAELDDLTARWAGALATRSTQSGVGAAERPVVAHNESDSVLTIEGRVLKVVPAAEPGPAERFRALSPLSSSKPPSRSPRCWRPTKA